MDSTLANDLSHALKVAYLHYFSPKAAPQTWGIISRVDNGASSHLIVKTRKKLHSVIHSTDRYESSAAKCTLKIIDVFENWLKENEAEAYNELQRLM